MQFSHFLKRHHSSLYHIPNLEWSFITALYIQKKTNKSCVDFDVFSWAVGSKSSTLAFVNTPLHETYAKCQTRTVILELLHLSNLFVCVCVEENLKCVTNGQIKAETKLCRNIFYFL